MLIEFRVYIVWNEYKLESKSTIITHFIYNLTEVYFLNLKDQINYLVKRHN